MAQIDDIRTWVTLAGAVIAAGVSSWSAWAKFHENEDKVKVGFGPLQQSFVLGYWLYVISKSSHPIYLKDYGFINESGRLLSLLELFEFEPQEKNGIYFGGKPSFDQRGDLFEIGDVDLSDEQIGAFAITAGQKRHTLDFQDDVPLYKRLWIRLKVRWKLKYQ